MVFANKRGFGLGLTAGAFTIANMSSSRPYGMSVYNTKDQTIVLGVQCAGLSRICFSALPEATSTLGI